MPYEKCSLPEYPVKMDMWDILAAETRPIIVYGMGNGADKLLLRFQKYGISVSDFFASDGFVRGHSFHGMRVKSFSEIKSEYEDFVIVLSFASNRQKVLEMLINIDKTYDLYIPDMPVAGDAYFDKDFYNSHYLDICTAYNSLCDTDSRNAFAAMISYKLSGRGEYLFSAYSDIRDIYSMLPSVTSVIDAGAYNGDTARLLLQMYPNIEKIHALEPDLRNFRKLSKYVSENKLDHRVMTYNAAAWDKECIGELIGSANRNSSVSSTSSHESRIEAVTLSRIDSLVSERVDLIKYDVEGAEREALIGSSELILKYRPSLLVSLYHRSEDIFSLIIYLSLEYPFYDFYLRRTLCVPAWELDLIAIPKEINF